jgi:DNA-binding beta-propeller fold protein YncE
MKPLLVLLALIAAALPALAAPALTPNAPVELIGTTGKFDFIKVDAANRRLLACHSGNGTLDIIDVDSSKLIKSVPTGNAQGVAIDEKGGRYFVSCSKPPQLAIVDSRKLEVTGQVPLLGPADICAYAASINRVFVDNDEKPEMWVIDPEAKTIVSTIPMPGAGLEDIGLNAGDAFLFQNLKATSELVKIDPKTQAIVTKWTTAPAVNPHGFAIMKTNAVLIAGGGGKLALLDLASGKVLASCDIAPKVDEIAYDPALARAYCASGTGQISVVFVAQDKLTPLGNVPSAPGAHSIAVDPKTHQVWIVFAKDNKPYVQSFTPKIN